MAHAESPAVSSRPALLDMSMPKASPRDGRGRLPLPSRRRQASNGFRAAFANEGEGARLGAERWMMNAHGAGGPKDWAPAHQRDGGRHCARVGFTGRMVSAVVRVAVSPLRREEHPKGMEERGAKRIRLPHGYSPAWVWRGLRRRAPAGESPPPGHPGRVWKVKGERRGRPRVMLRFAPWWSCRIGFVGSVWGFYGFWAIFVVKPPSFCDNSSKFGCFLRFSGFFMPFSVFLGVSVALVSVVGGVSGPVPGSPSPRFPARRKAAWGPPPGAWPSFLHQMGTP